VEASSQLGQIRLVVVQGSQLGLYASRSLGWWSDLEARMLLLWLLSWRGIHHVFAVYIHTTAWLWSLPLLGRSHHRAFKRRSNGLWALHVRSYGICVESLQSDIIEVLRTQDWFLLSLVKGLAWHVDDIVCSFAKRVWLLTSTFCSLILTLEQIWRRWLSLVSLLCLRKTRVNLAC